MRRSLVVMTAWITATVLAVTLAFAGVNLVADRVLDPDPAPVIGSSTAGDDLATPSADDVSDDPTASEDGEDGEDDHSDDPTPEPSGTAVPAPSGTASEPTVAASSGTPTPQASSPTASPAASSSPDDDPSDDPSDEPSDSPSASPTSSPTSSPSGTTAPAETRTYRMVGGTVTVRFSSSQVTVVSATPNAGFQLHELEQPAPTVVDLEFRANDDSHRSKLDAWWQDGPRERIREEARD